MTLRNPIMAPTSPPSLPSDDQERWRAWRARDPRADGTFVFSVRTTGVYCRPSCGARAARPENVAFHATPAEAMRAGFRACRRCRPDGPSPAADQTALVTQLCRLIELRVADGRPAPRLDELAAQAGLSAFHVHRLFKATTGLTPRAYAAAGRAAHLRTTLARGRKTGARAGHAGSITAAVYDAGYGSSGRFYAQAPHILGMTPTAFRAGGDGITIQHATAPCALGHVLVAATERGVCAILLGDRPQTLEDELQQRFPRARRLGAGAGFARTVARVVTLIEAPGSTADLPLDIRGTSFQQRVWQALRAIPAGQTATYAQLAAAIGSPRAVRAVAGACAANHLAVAVPCHRVVRTDGGLSGYRWGVDRKSALLRREGVRAPRPR